MSRISIPDRAQVPADTHSTLDGAEKALGFVPNLSLLMASSPNVLAGVTALQDALGKTLDVRTREAIALAISQESGCEYCLAAHEYLAATFAKISPAEVASNKQGESENAKRAAAVRVAKAVVETKGKASDADLSAVRAAGYSDAQVIEIVALPVSTLMTNFLNNAADTDVDFPAVAA